MENLVMWVGLLIGAVSATFQVLSWYNDRKLQKRNNPSSRESKTDHNVKL